MMDIEKNKKFQILKDRGRAGKYIQNGRTFVIVIMGRGWEGEGKDPTQHLFTARVPSKEDEGGNKKRARKGMGPKERKKRPF
jgi:hypothetical protein